MYPLIIPLIVVLLAHFEIILLGLLLLHLLNECVLPLLPLFLPRLHIRLVIAKQIRLKYIRRSHIPSELYSLMIVILLIVIILSVHALYSACAQRDHLTASCLQLPRNLQTRLGNRAGRVR